jgi:hypothetical protein
VRGHRRYRLPNTASALSRSNVPTRTPSRLGSPRKAVPSAARTAQDNSIKWATPAHINPAGKYLIRQTTVICTRHVPCRDTGCGAKKLRRRSATRPLPTRRPRAVRTTWRCITFTRTEQSIKPGLAGKRVGKGCAREGEIDRGERLNKPDRKEHRTLHRISVRLDVY